MVYVTEIQILQTFPLEIPSFNTLVTNYLRFNGWMYIGTIQYNFNVLMSQIPLKKKKKQKQSKFVNHLSCCIATNYQNAYFCRTSHLVCSPLDTVFGGGVPPNIILLNTKFDDNSCLPSPETAKSIILVMAQLPEFSIITCFSYQNFFYNCQLLVWLLLQKFYKISK